jgi:RNA polymerase sigma factor (TIGR02999 family)
MSVPDGDITGLLVSWREGNREALDQLMPLVYDALRRLAHSVRKGERRDGTIGTTALVHEAYVRLVDQRRARIEDRSHFYSLAARTMRRVLVDDARRRHAGKRGAGATPLPLDDVAAPGVEPDGALPALDEALTRLEAFDAHLSQVVELRYFGGLTFEQISEVFGTSTTSAWRDWNTARAWLHDALGGG